MDLQHLVDPAPLRTLRDDYGDDLATRLVGVFETTATATLVELRAAREAGDPDEVRRLAHRLKGSARNVGATAIAELAAAAEQDASAPVGRLGAALEPTCAQLRATLAGRVH